MRVASFLSITACAGPVLLLSCSSSLLPSFLLPRVKGRLEAEDENKATKQRAAEGRRIMLLQSRLLVEVVDDESKGRTCRSVFVDRARIIAVLLVGVLDNNKRTKLCWLPVCVVAVSPSVGPANLSRNQRTTEKPPPTNQTRRPDRCILWA